MLLNSVLVLVLVLLLILLLIILLLFVLLVFVLLLFLLLVFKLIWLTIFVYLSEDSEYLNIIPTLDCMIVLVE